MNISAILLSHPARGAWIEIYLLRVSQLLAGSHPARGAWIEMSCLSVSVPAFVSHPARGAWIEMLISARPQRNFPSHPARGAWIEIFSTMMAEWLWEGRTPQGVRGLKSATSRSAASCRVSHPARGAWIEIITLTEPSAEAESHPARGAWIEIYSRMFCYLFSFVAPRKGCVD